MINISFPLSSALEGLLNLRGGYNASGNLFPTTGGSGTGGNVAKGNTWYITTGGILGGLNVVPGDVIFANVDSPGQTAGNWSQLNVNFSPSMQNSWDGGSTINNYTLLINNTFKRLGIIQSSTPGGNRVNVFGTQAGHTNTGNDVNAFGNAASSGNSGSKVNAFGASAAAGNSGSDVNAFGDEAVKSNSGNHVNGFGDDAALANDQDNVNAFGKNAGRNNAGANVNTMGFEAGFNNSGVNVNTLGYHAGRGNTGTNINAFGENAARVNSANDCLYVGKNAGFDPSTGLGNSISGLIVIANANLTSFADHAAAVAAITVANGAVAGSSYLYHNQSTDSIGVVRL